MYTYTDALGTVCSLYDSSQVHRAKVGGCEADAAIPEHVNLPLSTTKSDDHSERGRKGDGRERKGRGETEREKGRGETEREGQREDFREC